MYPEKRRLSWITVIALFFLSAGGLAFEVHLTRFFSVAQFYHFAFMIVSIALLGNGASGSFLALFPRLRECDPNWSLGWLSLAAAIGMVVAYLFVNTLPFDSFSIAWDSRQVWLLALHYLALAAPFFFSGAAVGLLLGVHSSNAGRVYALNLGGSAFGCLLALLAPLLVGGEGMLALSGLLVALASLLAAIASFDKHREDVPVPSKGAFYSGFVRYGAAFLACGAVLFYSGDLLSRLGGGPGWAALNVRLSPYKGLSYALQAPGAQVVYRRWNAIARVDVVRSPSFHSFPGLSYRYLKALPPQDGLFVDGDDLSPLLDPAGDLDFAGWLLSALPYYLRPGAETLILGAGAGLDVLVAQELGAKAVVAVESNPLVVEAATAVYRMQGITAAVESERSYLLRGRATYDIVQLTLRSVYRPVRSGAYSLAEDTRYTMEAFESMLKRLNPAGILAVSRWLQIPPSESLRLFALAVESVDRLGGDPSLQLAALRGYNTSLILVKNQAWTAGELDFIRRFAAERAFDLIYLPGLKADEANRFNIQPEPYHYLEFQRLLNTRPRQDYYAAYAYDIRPPTDDRPFFGHYFKWEQARAVFAELGRVWQPFGGAGYFVILALLILAIAAAVIFILLPTWWVNRRQAGPGASPPVSWVMYFIFIGLAYLSVEIPLIQRFILYLDHPAYAITTVLCALLLFSGVGSILAGRLNLRTVISLLLLLLLVAPPLLPVFIEATILFSLPVRLAFSVFFVAPFGLLMGIPFPGGIRLSSQVDPNGRWVAWFWGANGAASVVAAILAALLALSWGYSRVLWLGALFYAGAEFMVERSALRLPISHRQ